MSKMQSTVLAACLLSLAAAAAAAPAFRSPDHLQAEPAMVVSADPAGHGVILKVPSAGRQPLAFAISRNCLYGGGLRSEEDLFPNERVLIWTEGGRAGKLPAIFRVERAHN